ncbi:MAG: sigma-70 family RNA polymerase sigma factor [Pirellulaceae bacterium]|nr:sigma-70 family RNA polymerase sigma factor [Pirellulaceae bacterium]
MNVFADKQATKEHLLWREVLRGDTNAFEQLVVQYQSAVSAVAFNILGDFPSSQDVAQETFWAAWNSRDKLNDSNRVGAWLCGISRNMAKQWRRKKVRTNEVSSSEIANDEAISNSVDPAEEFISKEEESVVWSALEKIPENYREVLVLYYQQSQSIEEVARTLSLSNAAARQRLARGREMLRNRVSNLIEGVLDRNNPTRSFTSRVMAGIAAAGVTGAAANASAATAATTIATTTSKAAASFLATKVASPGLLAGTFGGMLGAVGGLGGAWFGTWLPAEMAPTETERQLLKVRGKTAMSAAVLFSVGILVFTYLYIWFRWPSYYLLIGMGVFQISLMAFLLPFVLQTQRLIKELRKEISPEEDPNLSKIAKKFGAYDQQGKLKKRYRGRKYTSSIRFLGLPLVDIQVGDPGENYEMTKAQSTVAKGWLAIGDIAYGVIAIGGRAFGGIAFGGVSAGGIAIGGLSIGIVSLAGLAIGIFAIGGGAIGYDACGGGAAGWHSAVGGAAVANHVAMGGSAYAFDFAVGASARAEEVNTPLAHQMVKDKTLIRWKDNGIYYYIIGGTIVMIPILVFAMYRKREDEDGKNLNEK